MMALLLENRYFWMVLERKTIKTFMKVLNYLVAKFAYAAFVYVLAQMKIMSFAEFKMLHICDFEGQISSFFEGSWKVFKYL